MMPLRSRKITICAIMTTAGLIMGYIETFVVIPVSIPGIRIGLANISTLITLYLCGPLYALFVHILRIFMSSLLFGNASTLIYSLCGGMLAFAVMVVLKRFEFGMYGVSVGGAVFHNLGQTAVAAILINNTFVFGYMPPLALAGCVFGIITGAVSNIVISRLKNMIRADSEGCL